MKRIIAVNSNCYHGYSLEDAIDGIKAAGFHYIELTATKGWTEHVFPTQSFAYLCSIKDRLKNAGITPFAMSGHTNLMDKERIGDFVTNMKLAAFFGCDYIVSSVGEAHLKDKAFASNEEVAAQIRALVPYLQEYNLTLVLENHGDHATGQIVKGIVELVNSPRVLVNYDTANVIYFAGIDPVNDLPACVDKVGFLHIKDKIGGMKEWNFPALGKGSVDFPHLLRILEKAGNDSPLSIEIEFTSTGSKNLAEVNRAVKDSYDYLKSLGLEI